MFNSRYIFIKGETVKENYTSVHDCFFFFFQKEVLGSYGRCLI